MKNEELRKLLYELRDTVVKEVLAKIESGNEEYIEIALELLKPSRSDQGELQGSLPARELLLRVKKIFKQKLSVKTNWGRNQIFDAFTNSVNEALLNNSERKAPWE